MPSEKIALLLVLASLVSLNACLSDDQPMADAGGDGAPDASPDGSVVPPPDTWLVHVGSDRCRRYGNGLVEARDGGLAFAGFYDNQAGDAGLWLVRLDSSHEILWDSLLGRGDEWGADMALHPERGFLISGHSSAGATVSGWLAHLDEEGNALWQRSFAGVETLPSIASTEDGFLVAGFLNGAAGSEKELWIARSESDGSLLWQQRFPTIDASAASIVSTSDGGGIAAAQGPSDGAEWTWLTRFDEAGASLWQRRVSEASADSSRRFGVIETTDGGVALAMTARSGIFVVRLDGSGDLLWARSAGGPGEIRGGVAVAGPEGGVIVGGTETAFSSEPYNLFVVGFDVDGELIWQWSVVDEAVSEAHDAVVTADGGVVFLAGGCADTWILKVANDGTFHGDCDVLSSTSAVVTECTVSVEEQLVEPVVTDLEPSVSTPEMRESSSSAETICFGSLGD